MDKLPIFTKETLKKKLLEIRQMGWIPNDRKGNAGSAGNTLEDLLQIPENNLPLPNAGEWELKTSRKSSNALITLFHMEPSPRAFSFVPNILLPNYGWPHQEAGGKYPLNEMSFRQTIKATERTNRGFGINVNHYKKRIEISFDANSVDQSVHYEWLLKVKDRIGLGELDPQPYWGFEDLTHKIGSKLTNCVYVLVENKRINGIPHLRYCDMYFLSDITSVSVINAITKGILFIDFDARTGHNHGTKFRIKKNEIIDLYKESIEF
jgi:hypothetical protein